MNAAQSVASVVTTGIHVLVRQVTPDPIAGSAAYALVERLGERALLSVQRREYWNLTWALPREEAEERTAWLIENSTVFVHPSKHRWQMHSGDDPAVLLPRESSDRAIGAILIADSGPAPVDATRAGLNDLYPESAELIDLKRATWWELAYPPGAVADLGAHLEALALTRSRTTGLFCHPHYQEARILVGADATV